MYFWKSSRIRPSSAGPPSQLLQFIAGDFAARIAGVWPQPHAAFLAAPAARRHLACLALLHAGPETGIDGGAVLDRPLQRAIRSAVPGAPTGLARALERLGERAWSEADYRRLLTLLAGHETGKLLRHAGQIEAEAVRTLSRLPAPLLGLGRLSPGETAAELVGEAFAALAARDGPRAAEALAQRWTKVETLKRLAEVVTEDLEPDPPPPPLPGTARLRPLATKAAIQDAALRFKNCLRHQVYRACSGNSAFYEWIEPPGCVLEIVRDRLYGWTLEEARLPENASVPEPIRAQVIGDLRAMGVHVGRALWRLDDALTSAAADPPRRVDTEAQVIAELFGEAET